MDFFMAWVFTSAHICFPEPVYTQWDDYNLAIHKLIELCGQSAWLNGFCDTIDQTHTNNHQHCTRVVDGTTEPTCLALLSNVIWHFTFPVFFTAITLIFLTFIVIPYSLHKTFSYSILNIVTKAALLANLNWFMLISLHYTVGLFDNAVDNAVLAWRLRLTILWWLTL